MSKSEHDRKGLLYCSLLALQFGLQPIVASRYITPGVSKSSVVIATEVFKILIAVFSILTGPKAEIEKILETWSFWDSFKVAALPATMYAIQNLCVQYGYMYLDSMTFNLLNQTKTISAAFWLYIVMGQKQSLVQIFALVLLFASAMVLNTASSGAAHHLDHEHKNLGIVLVILASLLSGLSAALTQRVLTVSAKKRHVFLLSAEMAVYGILFLLLNLALNSDVQQGGGLLSNWTVFTAIPVITNALGGMVVGLVTKYAGGVVKGFALIAGIVITGVAQWIFENRPLGTKDFVGIGLVSAAIYLHSSFPCKPQQQQQPTTISLGSKEINSKDSNSAPALPATEQSARKAGVAQKAELNKDQAAEPESLAKTKKQPRNNKGNNKKDL